MRLPILILHISGGVLAMLAGAAAMLFRKGSDRHRMAGDVFVISMLCMGMAAAYLAFMKHQTGNVFGGMLTIYMVSTAWAAGRRREQGLGILGWGGFLFALAIGVLGVLHGAAKITGRAPEDGVPAGMNLFLGSVMLLASAGDLRMLVRGSIAGTQRVSRHLWRMCFGWFIATGSFFLGQQQVFPAALRKTNLLIVPAILPLILLVFWLIRVRFAKAFKNKGRSPAVGVPEASTVFTLKPDLVRSETYEHSSIN
jgi:hypothetical protein